MLLVVACSLDSCSGSMRDSKCNSPAGPSSPAESVTGGLMLTDPVGRATENASSSFTHVLRSLSRTTSRGQSVGIDNSNRNGNGNHIYMAPYSELQRCLTTVSQVVNRSVLKYQS